MRLTVSIISHPSPAKVSLKRQPEKPREARLVKTKNNKPTTITPVPYDSILIYVLNFSFGVMELKERIVTINASALVFVLLLSSLLY